MNYTKQSYFFLVVLLFFGIGCAPIGYYQLYSTSSDTSEEAEMLVYSDENVRMEYNLWNRSASCFITIDNLTDSNIFLDLGLSHLIVNGIAQTYYINKSTTNQSSILVSATRSNSQIRGSETFSGAGFYATSSLAVSQRASSNHASMSRSNAVTVHQERIICIPPHSAKSVVGPNLTQGVYRDCDLVYRPMRKEIKTISFTKETSPLHIRNFISYRTQEAIDGPVSEIDHLFWVKEITNYPSIEFIKTEYPEVCGKKVYGGVRVMTFQNPSSFYVQY